MLVLRHTENILEIELHKIDITISEKISSEKTKNIILTIIFISTIVLISMFIGKTVISKINHLRSKILNITASKMVHSNISSSTKIIENTVAKTLSIQREIKGFVTDAIKNKKEVINANEKLHTTRTDIINLTKKVYDTSEVEIELPHKIQVLSQEAAQAAEHGRSFAVVADEVRKLAERTQKSLLEISVTINVIVQSILESSSQMDSNSKEIEALAIISIDVEQNIQNVADTMSNAVLANENTVNNFILTDKQMKVIREEVENINACSLSNSSSAHEIISTSQHLYKITNNLNGEIEKYKV